MAVTHTNRKGKKYYLCCRSDSKGQNQYFFARRPSDYPVDVVPIGYEIRESETGQVALAKSKKTTPIPISTPKQLPTHKTPLAPTSDSPRKTKVEPKQSTSKKVRGTREKALHIEQITCGWCYKIIYEAWLPSGRNGYYEDKDLMTRHHCTRPVHWDPDHSGGPFEY